MSRHARSRLPITPQGLVEMGFRYRLHPDGFGEGKYLCIDVQAPTGKRVLMVAVSEGRLGGWCVDWGSLTRTVDHMFIPQFLGDVDWLIERLSR
jgi:hypothetical protein